MRPSLPFICLQLNFRLAPILVIHTRCRRSRKPPFVDVDALLSFMPLERLQVVESGPCLVSAA